MTEGTRMTANGFPHLVHLVSGLVELFGAPPCIRQRRLVIWIGGKALTRGCEEQALQFVI